MVPEKTLTLIEIQEGKSAHAYQDTKKIWTIGIGRNVDKKRGGPGLRPSEMQFMLENDVNELEVKLRAALPTVYPELSDVRKAVLISVAFNCGFNGLLGFHETLRAIAEKRWRDAAVELMDSDAARLLPQRYRVLAAMLSTDRWPSFV